MNFVGWKGNDTLLFSKDFGGDENFHVFSVSLESKEIKDLTPTKDERAYVIDDLYNVSEDSVLVASNRRLKSVSDVYKVNVKTGKSKMVLKNPGNQTGWVTDHNGVIRIAVSTDGVNNTYFYRENDKKDFRKIKTLSFKNNIQPLFFDFKNKNVYALTNVGWDKNVIVEMNPKNFKPVKYKTRDGLTIEGYLTLPKGKTDQKNLPLVVNPHGGPWARDVWGFNPEVQFLASRGYAVFQMNFRGSTGYGKKFWKASFKEWGKKMQNDITDGVMWLTEQEVADKDKICIYGGSYGGYATLAGLAFTPDLYKCGVDYVGVSNLFTFQATIPEYWKPYKKMLHEMVGHPEKDKVLLKSASPYYHADKIKAALFVAQGANDPRVKKAESDQIVSALKKRGVEVEYMVKDDEGHGFHNEENRFEFYNKMENFIRESIVY